MSNGFDGSWLSWYEKQADFCSRVLDGGLRRGAINTRMRLGEHRAHKARVDFLVKKYPGPFAESVLADWQQIHELLLGPERKLTAQDLEYRELGEKRAAEIAAAGERARAAFLEKHKDQTLEPFPAPDPTTGDLQKVAGKIVALPALGGRDWISEAGHGFLVTGNRREGYYFIDSRSPAMIRVFGAQYRFTQLVTPHIQETYATIGQILPSPALRVVQGVAVTGLAVDVLGATVGDRMFVDTTVVQNNESPFTGQELLLDHGEIKVLDNATPQQVMEAAVWVLKVGNEPAWSALFAPWEVSKWGGNVYIDPHIRQPAPAADWVRARRVILNQVYDVNVIDVGPVQQITTGKEFEGAPVIDEVEVDLEHIGKFEEGYRPFLDINVQRVWTLQRMNNGPWRIVTRRGI